MLALSRQIEEQAESTEMRQQFVNEARRELNGSTVSDARFQAAVENAKRRWLREEAVRAGTQCARSRGWHDSYTFTKAMGERAILEQRGDLPTVILRPSIIESSLAEPEPGWLDGFRMADPIIAAYGRGRLRDFPADPDIVVDLIPLDFVVNATLAAIPKAAREGGLRVYHVASGADNPMQFRTIYELSRGYFLAHPMRDKKGELIKVNRWKFSSRERFLRTMRWRYLIPLTAAQWGVERGKFLPGAGKLSRRLASTKLSVEQLLYYTDIYGPYATSDCRFETGNTRQLFRDLSPEDKEVFNFDVSRLDWRYYMQDVHIPGLKRHVLRLDAEAPADAEVNGSISQWEKEFESEIGNAPVRTLRDVLLMSAAKFPDKVALQIKRNGVWTCFTYQQVEACARRVSAELAARGVQPGDRVVLCAENQPEWGIAALGVVCMGATLVPMDRQTPPAEVWEAAQFTEAKVVITDGEYGLRIADCGLNDGDVGIALLNLSQLRDATQSKIQNPKSKIEDVWGSLTPDHLASIVFTTGVTVDPKGVMLTHRNFVANARAIARVLRPLESDRFLSLLPLSHTFEFTCGFLMPLYGGATITYVDSLKSRVVLDAMRETGTTCLLGVPRLFQMFYDAIHDGARRSGRVATMTLRWAQWQTRTTEKLTGRNVGRQCFAWLHRKFGGKVRLFVSGGAALDAKLYEEFRVMGFPICEGYGLTETAPVLTVNPIENRKPGSVGPPLPGVEVRIDNADERGIGEIVVRGGNVMEGYFRNPEATAKVLRDGWFYTGDLGTVDADGYVFITGRLKDVIVTGAGKNVYPEEVELRYRDLPHVKELCVVGVQGSDGHGEEVHAVVTLTPEATLTTEQQQARGREVLDAVHNVSRHLPTYQRLQGVHFWEEDLPRTMGLAIDRSLVKEQLTKREGANASRSAAPAEPIPPTVPEERTGWQEEVVEIIASISQFPNFPISSIHQLEAHLGLDSLRKVELVLALEERFGVEVPEEQASHWATVADVLTGVERAGVAAASREDAAPSSRWEKIIAAAEPEAAARLRPPTGLPLRQRLTFFSLRTLYGSMFDFEARGLENLPQNQSFIVAANHSSHLDTPALIVALNGQVPRLYILGAKDYFFNTRLRGWFFHSFLNVLPFDRYGNFLDGLRTARDVLAEGFPVLVFPEGTRSVTGELQPFKAGLGLLALEAGVPIVPAAIRGAYESFPKGRALPKPGKVTVTFAPPVPIEPYRTRLATGAEPRELYQEIVAEVRRAIEEMME